jgi:L-amino acid N-acyltransferase YncA
MLELVLRPATVADAAELAAIYRPSVLTGTASFEIDPPDSAEMARRLAAIVDAGYPYLVAEYEGAIVGYGYVNAYRPRPAYKWTVEDSIYLAPAAQGLGIGRALLTKLIETATAQGFRQMVAVVGDSAQYPSIRLHRACGFQFAGTVHAIGFKHGRWLDVVTMQRPLGDGDLTAPAGMQQNA